jgi:hypothetical protein
MLRFLKAKTKSLLQFHFASLAYPLALIATGQKNWKKKNKFVIVFSKRHCHKRSDISLLYI